MNITTNVAIPSFSSAVPLMSVGGWLTVLSRIDINFPVGLAVSNYTDGFGDINTNFWLGLEKTYQLTNSLTNGGKIYRLRVELLDGSTGR